MLVAEILLLGVEIYNNFGINQPIVRLFLLKTKLMKEQRPRVKRPTLKDNAIADPMEYIRNKCTENAKHIKDYVVELAINLYGDQHYFIRHQLGDENGKRDGIEPEIVMGLVENTMVHLFYYSSLVPSFSFIDTAEINERKHLRIVLQKMEGDGVLLNVVSETHLISPFEYEITVITAMKSNDFFIVNGQYVVELTSGGNSILRKKHNNVLSRVASTL